MQFNNKNKKDSYSAYNHYKGGVVSQYNKKRTASLKWRREQILINKIMNNLPDNSVILDLPIGTGRLLPFYKNSHSIIGIDISKDMLKETRNNSSKIKFSSSLNLKQGDAENINLKGNSVDYVICLRLLNLVPLPVLKKIIQEFTRVSQKGLIIQVRVYEKLKKLELLLRFFLDFRTNLNSLIHKFLIKLSLTKFKKSEINTESDTHYFLHSFKDIKRIIIEKKLDISEIYYVDRGLDFKNNYHKPFIIMKCMKN